MIRWEAQGIKVQPTIAVTFKGSKRHAEVRRGNTMDSRPGAAQGQQSKVMVGKALNNRVPGFLELPPESRLQHTVLPANHYIIQLNVLIP